MQSEILNTYRLVLAKSACRWFEQTLGSLGDGDSALSQINTSADT